MKEKLGWIFCLLLVLVIASQTFLQKGQADEKDMWEYKSMPLVYRQSDFENSTQPKLNKLGEEGWELSGISNNSDENYLILKRKKK